MTLALFSLAYLIRGSYDLYVSYWAGEETKLLQALFMFMIYFVTEWVPIFAIYFHHASLLLQISNLRKKRSLRAQHKQQMCQL